MMHTWFECKIRYENSSSYIGIHSYSVRVLIKKFQTKNTVSSNGQWEPFL